MYRKLPSIHNWLKVVMTVRGTARLAVPHF